MAGPNPWPGFPKPADADIKLKATKRKRRARVSVKMEHPTHGKIEVHSMKGVVHGEPCTLMAAAVAGAEADQPVWIQIAKAGTFKGHSAGAFEMNAKTFSEIIANFKAHPEHIPVDFEHASEAPASEGSIPHTGAPAQGWIVDMKVGPDGNLYGLVEWGALARDYIKNGQYKYFSPAIRFGAKDRVSGAPIGARMTSGALTNSPFLSGMQKVAAKDGDDDELDELDDGEDGDINEDTPASAADLTETETNTMDAKMLKDTEDKLAVMTDKFTLADTKRADLEKTVTAKDAELTMVKTENAALLSWKTERENKDHADEVDAAFATYKDQRKLTDAMKPAMLATLKAAPDAFRTMYPAVDLDKRHLLRTVAVVRTKADESETETEIPDVVTLSDKLRKEGMSHFDALSEADKRIRAMRKRSA